MQTTNARVTAQMWRTEDGEILTEYCVNGVTYHNIDAVGETVEGV